MRGKPVSITDDLLRTVEGEESLEGTCAAVSEQQAKMSEQQKY